MLPCWIEPTVVNIAAASMYRQLGTLLTRRSDRTEEGEVENTAAKLRSECMHPG